MFESAIIKPVERATGRIVPVFSSSQAACREVFVPGKATATLAVIDGVPLINEKCLTWEQVSEVRADKGAQQKLRRFLFWMKKEYANQPLSVIREGIEIQLADYEAAAKKHSLECSLGRLSVMLDGSLWLSLVAAWQEIGAGVAGISVLGARAILEHYKCKQTQKKESDHPIAYIYELRNRTS